MTVIRLADRPFAMARREFDARLAADHQLPVVLTVGQRTPEAGTRVETAGGALWLELRTDENGDAVVTLSAAEEEK